jgi:hypothetical protein
MMPKLRHRAMAKGSDAFTRAYIEAALWSSSDSPDDESESEPLDKNYGPGDIDPETMRAMEHDCADFQHRFGSLIEDDESQAINKWGRWELAGHDFWLSRNGHGAGFGDGNFPRHDDELHDAAKSYGDFELYVGDDGVIHASGHEPGAVNERHLARDFTSIPALIDHARDVDGATHVLIQGRETRLYFPHGREYEEAVVYPERGYWHVPAPRDRTVVSRLPPEAEAIARHTPQAAHEVSSLREPGPFSRRFHRRPR